MSDSDLQAVTQYLQDNQQVVYLQVVMLAFMILTLIVTFTDEVERVWKARQSPVTVIFYIIRYIPPLWNGFTLWSHAGYDVKISEGGCRVIWCIDLAVTVVIIILSQALVLTRTWALYDFSCRVVVFFVVTLLADIGLQVWASIDSFAALVPLPQYPGSASIPGCQINHNDGSNLSILVVGGYAMVATLIVFMFMLNRCLARNSLEQPFLGSWRDLLGIRTALPVVHVLMRDGCAYFLIVSCYSLCMLILIGCTNRPSIPYILVLGQTLFPMPATIMVLNLRGHVENGDHGRGVVAADIVLGEISDVHFAHRSSFDADVSYIQSYNHT